MLDDFTAERESSLRESVVTIQSGIENREEEIRSFNAKHRKVMGQLEKRGIEDGETLKRRLGEGKRIRNGAFKVRTSSR